MSDWAERTYVDFKRAQYVAALWHELGERAFDAWFSTKEES